MAFADDLLKLAQELADLHPDSQASLRRAVSTAYYALFHLLVSEATSNWARPELRPALGRIFNHGPMKTASENKIASLNAYFIDDPPESPERTVNERLYTIADTFIQAQQRREDADYNTAKVWTPDEVKTQIVTITEAFRIWDIVRDEAMAQAYLVSFLGTKERRQNERRKQPKRTERKKKQTRPDSPPTP